MKIHFVNTVDNKGGAAKIALALKSRLRDLGHTTNMFVKHKRSKDESIHLARWPNILTKIIQTITGKDIGSYIANKIRPLLSNDIEYFKSDKILETKEFKEADIVHCHNLHGNYFNLDTLRKMSALKPVVWTLHDMWAITAHCARIYKEEIKNGFYVCDSLEEYQSLSWDNTKHLEERKRNIYKTLKNIQLVVPSHWMKERVTKSVLSDKPTTVIHNGIDTKIFLPLDKKESRKILGFPEDKKIVLFIVADVADKGKGWDHIKQVCEKNKGNESILFVCVGQRDNSERNLAGNVRYVEYLKEQNEVARMLNAVDVLLYPSLAESFGLTVAEALSCSTPAVIFEAGGLPEIIGHKENGYVAHFDDNNDLESGLEYILNLAPLRLEEMRKHSREKAVKEFDIEKMTNNYIDLYNSLLSKD